MGGGGPSCGHNAVVDDPIAVLRQFVQTNILSNRDFIDYHIWKVGATGT